MFGAQDRNHSMAGVRLGREEEDRSGSAVCAGLRSLSFIIKGCEYLYKNFKQGCDLIGFRFHVY